uniref:Restriction endonuclease n=1 Tax=Candidatus Kentrum sp. TUN TaxID=2126343 RepID=A0A451AIR5_9GAMM|nr:MAG: Restriction endonuclease [Candidatus Kentron sp. TUN]VFK65931.1 MAG: Restriction endonuclease [Candidatus Kentron sp. TUN]
MANLNTEYEHLVSEILQGMIKYGGRENLRVEHFENLRVEHNVSLVGRSGARHQIDVFWEFKVAGMTYRTCVECKNYSSAVKKSHVAAFSAILADIGNVNGIIATTGSFQKGAKLLAEHNYIRLVLVNNLLKTIHITMQMEYPNYSNLSLGFNQDSIREARTRNGLEKCDIESYSIGKHPLLDASGNSVATFNTVLNRHQKTEGRNRIENIGLYLEIEGLGMVLLDSIDFDVSYAHLPPTEIIIESPNSAVAVIEEIVEDNRHYLHNDGSVSQAINNT